MMKLRAVLAMVILVVCMGAFHRFVVLPYRCSHLKRNVEAIIQRFVVTEQPSLRLVEILRVARVEVHRCMRHMPHDLDLRMEAAACDLFLGRRPEAIEQYQAALRIDRRPEIYLNLGNTLFEAGRRREAIDAFGALLSFTTFMINYDTSLPWSSERVLDLVPADIRKEVIAEADRRRAAARPR